MAWKARTWLSLKSLTKYSASLSLQPATQVVRCDCLSLALLPQVSNLWLNRARPEAAYHKTL